MASAPESLETCPARQAGKRLHKALCRPASWRERLHPLLPDVLEAGDPAGLRAAAALARRADGDRVQVRPGHLSGPATGDTMTLSPAWEDFVLAARGGRPERVPVALIVDSPWLPGFAGMDTLDFFLDERAWLQAHLELHARFPEVLFLPGFWVEYGMANEPSAFGARVLWHHDSPPGLRHLPLPPSEWASLPRPDPEKDGLLPLVLRRLERLERGGLLPEPHRLHMVAARGPLAVPAHVLGVLPLLEATALEPEATHAALDAFTETAIRFLRAQLERLREPVGILVLDDIPGMLS